MPVHDWTRVDDELFHDFHTVWLGHLRTELNSGILPPDYYAIAEGSARPFVADVLTLSSGDAPANGAGGAALQTAPRTRLQLSRRRREVPPERRIAVRRANGDHVVALIELVSRGNKKGAESWGNFVGKTVDAVRHGLHVLVVDLWPPGRFDPAGSHGAIWRRLTGARYEPPEGEPLALASYEAGERVRAYVEPTAVGRELFTMPLFLTPGRYVDVPLEGTYLAAYRGVPRRARERLEA